MKKNLLEFEGDIEMFIVQLKISTRDQTWQTTKKRHKYKVALRHYKRMVWNFRIMHRDPASPILSCRLIDDKGNVWDQFATDTGFTRSYNNDHTPHLDQTKTLRELYPQIYTACPLPDHIKALPYCED